MKVQEINQINNAVQSVHPSNAETTAGLSFSKLLEAQLAKSSHVAGTSHTTSVNASKPVAAGLRIESLALSEDILTMLDAYGNALSNQSFPIAELQPYIEDLEEKASALLELKNQIPAQDSLAKLVDGIATAAYLETAKYRRGDYSV